MSFNLLEKCEEYFDTRDLYEVLQVERDASEKEIKKAYHRLSLFVHPDRVDENHKIIATEKFKVLSKIHSILQNKEKRNAYNDSGEIDEESDMGCSWMDYWKSIFRPITDEQIKQFERDYIGSDTEVRDLKKAYMNGKGCMNYIVETVPFSNCSHESRYIEIIRRLVDNGEVEEYSIFFNEPKHKKNRRKRKEEKERAEFEEMKDTLKNEIEENSKKRQEGFLDLIAKIEANYVKKTNKRKSITNDKSGSSKKRK